MAYCRKCSAWGFPQGLSMEERTPRLAVEIARENTGGGCGRCPTQLHPTAVHPSAPSIQPQVTSTARSLNGATIWSLFCHFSTWCQCFLGFRPKGPHLNPDTGDILGCVVGGRGGHSDAVYSLVTMGECALTSSSRALQEPTQNPSPFPWEVVGWGVNINNPGSF